ncbi:plastocyanin/azurin family copper-binding protein [Pseudomonas sp. BGI-2]|uniref:cupredoxin domain-containing protein n=1 Tax=Pseudomonas sp. BGI-2 TaxID=2528211 RepID=UPI001033A6E4|nr:plastocyanin/azurin family copper-binding protein [Pseudomonas sp. BGI-2]TBN47125.1 plastocyanin [Pseudomonas sp. BGI-2]
MKRSRLQLLIAGLLFVAATQVFAQTPGSETSIGRQAQATPATRTVFVKMDDISYGQKSIDVKPGETVRFVLKNDGALMHEFNIGKSASQLEHQREMAALFKDGTLTPTGKAKSIVWREHFTAPSDSDPPGYPEVIEAKHDDPNAILVEPGTTKEFVWTFADVSNLNFACTLPGHYQAGMVGEFVMR